jgi:predicted Rossmann-fold nucleotide-binding protein
MQPIPVLLYCREYWNKVIDFQFLADEGTIRDEHLSLIQYVETPAEAWGAIRDFYRLPA